MNTFHFYATLAATLLVTLSLYRGRCPVLLTVVTCSKPPALLYCNCSSCETEGDLSSPTGQWQLSPPCMADTRHNRNGEVKMGNSTHIQ